MQEDLTKFYACAIFANDGLLPVLRMVKYTIVGNFKWVDVDISISSMLKESMYFHSINGINGPICEIFKISNPIVLCTYTE